MSSYYKVIEQGGFDTDAFWTVRYLKTLDFHYFNLMQLARSQWERVLEQPEYYEHPVSLSPLHFLFPELQTQHELPF